jgi:DNA-binding ferritin-like protein (Dps family)
MNQKKRNFKQYTAFCGGINGDYVTKYKQIIKYICLNKYIKSIRWRVAERLSYI